MRTRPRPVDDEVVGPLDDLVGRRQSANDGSNLRRPAKVVIEIIKLFQLHMSSLFYSEWRANDFNDLRGARLTKPLAHVCGLPIFVMGGRVEAWFVTVSANSDSSIRHPVSVLRDTPAAKINSLAVDAVNVDTSTPRIEREYPDHVARYWSVFLDTIPPEPIVENQRD